MSFVFNVILIYFFLEELESCYHGGSHLIKVMFPVNPATPGLALVTFQDEQGM